MKINLDGTIIVDAGEPMPFICPKCQWPIKYEDNILIVNCFHCGYKASWEEFEADFDDEVK